MSDKLIEAMAIMVYVEGMKILNKERLADGGSVAYDEYHFYEKSEELRVLAARHDDG